MRCRREDEVVARFLDGDVANEVERDIGDTFGSGIGRGAGNVAGNGGGNDAELEEHLRSCATCRAALARSRHLDALLASSTEVDVDAPLAERLLARAVAAATPVATAATATAARSEGRRRLPWLAIALGFALGLLVTQHKHTPHTTTPTPAVPAPAQPTPAEAAPYPAAPSTDTNGRREDDAAAAQSPLAPTVDTARAWPRDMLVLPDRPSDARESSSVSQASRLASRSALERAVSQLEANDLESVLSAHALVRAWALGLPAPDRRALDACAQAMRTRAGLALLAQTNAALLAPLCRAINRRDDTGRVLCDAAARQREFRSRLRAALLSDGSDDLGTAAVRLGDPQLDRRLLTLCRRDAGRADLLADACAGAARDVDRVDFLLELWAQSARAGSDAPGTPADDVRRAHRWFAALPDAATTTLLAHLQRTRSGEVRRRVFLALAARRDPVALASLLQWVESPNTTDAGLAAYALGCYENRFGTRLLASLQGSRRPELIWTALASQGDARVRAALQRCGATRAELDFVSTGSFHPDQIAAVASLLRACDPSSLNLP